METTPQFFRHGPSPLARLVFFVLLSLILMAVDTHFKYLHEIRQTVAVVIYPVQRLSYLPTTIYDLVSELFVTENLADEIAHLKQQHLVDSGKLQQLLALRAENEHLRKLLETTPRNKSKAIMAEILSVPRDPFNLKIMLDKGFQNGIQSGSGTGKYRTLELRYMANNIDIESGDVLVTSGIDGVYPSGLPVALVSKIKRNNASHAFAEIACTPIAGVDRNRQVLILSPRLPSPENLTGSESTDIQPNDKERKEIGVR